MFPSRPPTHQSRGRPSVERLPRVYPQPLYYSALYGFYSLVEQLVIKDPQHVNTVGGRHGSPLLAALWGKHFQVAEFLLELGADIDIRAHKDKTPLHKVIRWSYDADVDAIQLLLKHGADVNARRDDLSTPLHRAIIKDVSRPLSNYLCTRQRSILETRQAKLRCIWCRPSSIAPILCSGLRSYY